MLRAERQKKIKSILDEKHHAKITELSKWLNVSEMTIHRDLKPLIEDGAVIKTFGGVSLVEEDKTPQPPQFNLCVYCHRQINNRFSYRLNLDNTRVENTCCVHCGLLRESQLGLKNVQGICYDFLTHVTISSKTAWFVIGADLDLGCCQPTVLPFGQWGHAERFTKGFNGKIYNFQEALQFLVHSHSDSNCHCSNSVEN